MAGNQVAYGAKKCETGLSAVSPRPCGPLTLIPVNGKKNEIGGKIRTEKLLRDRSEWKLYFS